MQFQYYVTIALLVSRHTGLVECQQTALKKSDRIATCSAELSDMIERLCSKKLRIIKRESPMIDKLAPKDLRLHINAQAQGLSYERWRRVRRQVATECCVNQCTFGDLIMYCSDDDKLVQEDPDIFD